MDKKTSLQQIFYSHATPCKCGITSCVTAGAGFLGQRIIEGAAPIVTTMARGDISAVGWIAGGIAGFLICATALKL